MSANVAPNLPPYATLNVVRAFAKTFERVEPNTAGHLSATGRFALALARRLKLRPAAARVVHLGAMLHDVGKIAVPPTLLLRQGRLSAREFALIQEHPVIGWEIVSETGIDPAVATLIRQHHERIDGSGYPDRLSDGAIMPEAMVVAIADEVHALISHRAYKGGMDEDAVIRILDADGSTRLPRPYVDAALDLLREIGVDRI